METQVKVKILPEVTPPKDSKLQTYSFRPRMDHKSRSHSCPNSPSWIPNADELSPPSTYFRNRSSGQHISTRNHVEGAESSTPPNEETRRNDIEVMYYGEPTSPKISCTGHIKRKKKPTKEAKGVEVEKHESTFLKMLCNLKKSKYEVRRESNASCLKIIIKNAVKERAHRNKSMSMEENNHGFN
ncbi:uncharacterized protein LOC131656768 [Vicia villosa]|uniref:uncharacterized protein LOC131656768 n=1 Tax=Vicia villosa TaxID=3911 RepID=UPI00273C17DE|nr:uncharacterized protein LOC131656768 [Vicia villosa]